jgi:hypothetical protein
MPLLGSYFKIENQTVLEMMRDISRNHNVHISRYEISNGTANIIFAKPCSLNLSLLPKLRNGLKIKYEVV